MCLKFTQEYTKVKNILKITFFYKYFTYFYDNLNLVFLENVKFSIAVYKKNVSAANADSDKGRTSIFDPFVINYI